MSRNSVYEHSDAILGHAEATGGKSKMADFGVQSDVLNQVEKLDLGRFLGVPRSQPDVFGTPNNYIRGGV